MIFQFTQQPSCDGFMNMAISSIKFGKRKINLHAYLGIWMRLISKLRENGVISIVQLIKVDTHWIIQLRKKRDYQAGYAFMKRLVKHFGEPTVLTIDKAPTLLFAFYKLRKQGFCKTTIHCTIKRLNNLIEQNHRHVKKVHF